MTTNEIILIVLAAYVLFLVTVVDINKTLLNKIMFRFVPTVLFIAIGLVLFKVI